MVVHQVCYTGEGVLVRDVVEIVVILLDVVVSALVLVPVVGTVIGTQVRERCQWTHHMDKLYMLALLDVRIMTCTVTVPVNGINQTPGEQRTQPWSRHSDDTFIS